MKPRRKAPTILTILVATLVGTYAIVLWALHPSTPGDEVSYDQMVRQIGRVADLTYLAQDDRLTGSLNGSPFYVPLGRNEFVVAQLISGLRDLAPGAGLTFKVDAQDGKYFLNQTTQWALPAFSMFIAFAVIFTIFRSGAGTQVETSQARRFNRSSAPRVTFKDVAGLDEAIEELREVKDFLTSPRQYAAIGARPPRGVLLAGPPGCGKTLLVKAIAGEARVPFFSVSASEFVEMFAGVGSARVRDLFQKARAAAPSIIFVDELDAIGRARSASTGSGQEWEATLNELLVQVDGFDPRSGVMLIAATNRLDLLDAALVRKGRFDRQVVIDLPDVAQRAAIFRVHAAGKPLSPDVDLDAFARRTSGFSGADISAVMNEAAVVAARRRRKAIGPAEMSEAIDRVIAGPERRGRIIAPEEKERVARHESGHVIAGWMLNRREQIEKVSIVSRGHLLGLTQRSPTEDHKVVTREQLEEDLTFRLAGRAAEILAYGGTSSGSRDDLTDATHTARMMVCQLGMSEVIGPVVIAEPNGTGPTAEPSTSTASAVDAEIRSIISAAQERAVELLSHHRERLDRLTELLVARETLERKDLEALLMSPPVPAPPPAPAPLSS